MTIDILQREELYTFNLEHRIVSGDKVDLSLPDVDVDVM